MKQCTCYALRAVDCTCKPAKYGELYTSPTTKQEQGEPLCTAAMFDDAFLAKSGLSPDTKLYTTPQQRTWVGLTDEEMIEHIKEFRRRDIDEFDLIRDIEAKLKEKNT
jgi:hypothetical protein